MSILMFKTLSKNVYKEMWILLLFIVLNLTYPTTGEVSIAEKFALYDFYNSTNGENWYPIKWNTTDIFTSPCKLANITCYNNDTITSIILINNNLNGTIHIQKHTKKDTKKNYKYVRK